MADAVSPPPPPPAGRRARGAHAASEGSGARAAARRAARLPAGALQALPSVSLPDDSSTSTLVLFVLLVVVINTGLLHTVLWGLFLAALVVSCFRVLVLVALMQTAAAASAAAAEAGGDVERGEGGASATGADGRVNPVLLQMQLLGRELTAQDYNALLSLDENGGGGAPRRGVPRAALEQMPTHAFRAAGTAAAGAGGENSAGNAGGITCAVCLEDPEDGQTLRTLPCLHQFHAACIDRWLESSDSCPVCKTRVLPPTP